MSLASLCATHSVDFILDTASRGVSMGVEYTQSTVSTGNLCNIQRSSAREIEKYGVRGVAIPYLVFFNYDPELTTAHTMKFGSKYLRVYGVFPETNGVGTDLLWIVVCDEETSRQET